MKRKLIGFAAVLITLTAMSFAKEKAVNDGTVGKYVKVELEKSVVKDFDAILKLTYNSKFPNGLQMAKIPEKNYEMLKTEVTQELYAAVMGENPSYFKGDNRPVENVSWYDAIMFCNRLSEMEGLTPVYAVDGKTDTVKWNYTPHKENGMGGTVTQDTNATGYRLPTLVEWQYAAKGGQDYSYAGSSNLDEVGWYHYNSGDVSHPVGGKKANGYGLYDMSGNVDEWSWDLNYNERYYCGGNYSMYGAGNNGCGVYSKFSRYARYQSKECGFRIVRTVEK